MARFLMIENDANYIPSVDMLTTLGLSGSRGKDRIGQFGTGFNHGLAKLARTPYRDQDGIYHDNMLEDTRVCLGASVCTYMLKEQTARKANGESLEYKRIFMQGRDAEHTGSNKLYDLNMSAGMGANDWTTVWMAIREFISNAFDGQADYGSGKPNFEIVETDKRGPRAKKGKIRVYVPLTEEVEQIYGGLKDTYLMMRDNYDAKKQVIHKPTFANGLYVYKKGVLVYVDRDADACFSYNIDVELDESRNAKEYAIKSKISEVAAREMNSDQLAAILRNPSCFEYDCLEAYDFRLAYEDESFVNARRAVYQDAFKSVYGGAIVCGSTHERELVERKGYLGAVMNPILLEAFSRHVDNTSYKILSKDEKEGRVIVEAPESIRSEFDRIWSKVLSFDMNGGKDKPSLKCFASVDDGLKGFYEDNTVYISKDQGGTELIKTLLEEFNHHCSGARDLSREFQEWTQTFLARMIG